MTRFGLTAAVLAAGVLLWSSTANANNITVKAQVSGGSLVTVVPSSPSPITVPTTTVGNFTMGGAATGNPPLTSGSFDTDIIVAKSSGPGTTITLWFTIQGLTSPTGNVTFTSGLTSNFLTKGWSANLSTFLDSGNGVAPPSGASLAFAHFTTGPSTQVTMTTLPTGAGPYSLEEVYAITAGGGPGDANVTIDLSGVAPPPVIPEPTTLALLGSGLVGIAALRRRH